MDYNSAGRQSYGRRPAYPGLFQKGGVGYMRRRVWSGTRAVASGQARTRDAGGATAPPDTSTKGEHRATTVPLRRARRGARTAALNAAEPAEAQSLPRAN